MKIAGKNIRATALRQFWGDRYGESVYLWQGAKHELPLDAILNCSSPVLKDMFVTQQQIQQGHDFCKSYYYRILPILSQKLNAIHGLSLPLKFWQTAFGYWLYRHIAIAYDKYRYLETIDIDANSIKLLDRNDFYIPVNHYDYIYCFACDFGVQQLISQYYYLFKKTDFEIVNGEFTNFDFTCAYSTDDSKSASIVLRKKYESENREPEVALLSVCFSPRTLNILREKSRGSIDTLLLPPVTVRPCPPDAEKRRFLAGNDVVQGFDGYFLQTLYYCVPKDFIENFREYYGIYQKDIAHRKFTQIVSECWISHIPTSLYVGLAKANNREFVAYEHGSGEYFYKNSLAFIDHDVADTYLTVGSKRNNPKIVQGGFAGKDILPYGAGPNKRTILFVGKTIFPYWFEYNEWSPVNSSFIKTMKTASDFIDLLPDDLRPDFKYRPRIEHHFWDTEKTLQLRERKIPVDKGDFAKSISQAKIVVIDHISTGFAEVLLMGVPFILLNDITFVSFPDELSDVFKKLMACGVVHTNARSAVDHLSNIHGHIHEWWSSQTVQHAVASLREMSVAPASKTIDYLMSQLKTSSKECSLDDFVRDSDGVYQKPYDIGSFEYSDGAADENYLLNIVRRATDLTIFSEELRCSIRDWVSEYHFSQERHNLLRHLELSPDMKILELGCGCGAITRQLGESGAAVTAVEGSLQRARIAAARCRDLSNVGVHCSNFQDVRIEANRYDVVTLIGVLEYAPLYFQSSHPVQQCLEIACGALKPEGVLVVAIENQLGLKYFNGYREDHADVPYFGIENRYNRKTAVTFGRQELHQILNATGFSSLEFHYPFSDYKVPKAILTQRAFKEKDFYPGEIIRQMNSRDYAGNLKPAFDEGLVVPQLCRNGMMEDLSHSFLVFAAKDDRALDRFRDPHLLAAVYSTDRANAYNVETRFAIRHGDIFVRKRRLLPGGSPVSSKDVLEHVLSDEKYIGGANLEAEYRKYIVLQDAENLFRLIALQLAYLQTEAIQTPHPENICMSSIKPDFFDCVPSNLILSNGNIYYIDREWRLVKRMSFSALLLRTVDALVGLDSQKGWLTKEKCLVFLSKEGFPISKEMMKEYDALIEDVVSQVYKGSHLNGNISYQASDPVKKNIEELHAAVAYLPKSSCTISRFQEIIDQVLRIQADPEHAIDLENLERYGPTGGEDLELCHVLLDMIDRSPSWRLAADYLDQLASRIGSQLETGRQPARPTTPKNSLENFKRFSYGDRFSDFMCPNPFLYAELVQNGDIGCCCYLPFQFGNIKADSIMNIWNSEIARELRRSIISGEYCYCDLHKCAAMQEAASGIKKATFTYQLPYRMIRKDRIDHAILRAALDTGNVQVQTGPQIISFEDDPSCNLCCPSCRRQPQVLPREQSMSKSIEQHELLDRCGHDVKELWFSGAGEPLASKSYRDLFRNYNFNRFSHINFRLDTNGTLLDKQAWDTVLNKIKNRIKLIAVSVDAATESAYDAIRCHGHFGKLMQNLRFIASLPERKQGLAFIIRMIVQKKNFREMKQFVQLGRSLAVDSVVFSVMQNWGTFTDQQYLDQAVHLSGHPEHRELCQLLRDPVFQDPIVDLGNLTQLHIEQIDVGVPGKISIGKRSTSLPSNDNSAPRVRVFAFYLPQFHPIAENDRWWGKGFTEWTNVGKARPLFNGHYQPHVPSDLGYYDLRLPETRQAQADLARKYGVEAFCYWHYWFAGHRLLERPFEEVVRSGQPDFPFCLGWANQTWSGIWHGAPDRILIEQTYPGIEDYIAHFNALLPAFRDPRYVTINGKLVFLIYAPQNLPSARKFTACWEQLARQAALPGFHFIAHGIKDPENYGCQSCVDNAPFVGMQAPAIKVRPIFGAKTPQVHHYTDFVRHLASTQLAVREHPLVMPNWDNTPRSGINGLVLHDARPELFRRMMQDAVAKAEVNPDREQRIVFVKAWNEWAEGNHLEPDLRYGHAYLQALADVVLSKTGSRMIHRAAPVVARDFGGRMHAQA